MKHFIALCLFIAVSQTYAQQLLQYNLTTGTTFNVEQVAKQLITQDLQGVDQVIENTLSSTMQFKVTDVNENTITLQMTFKSMKMLMSSPSLGVLLDADTSKESDDMTVKMFKGSLNIPVTVIMEKTGKINSVTGGDKLIESMFKAANITDPAIMESSKGQFEKQFGSDALSQSFEQMTYYLPAKKVAVNTTWTSVFSGNLEAKNTWTLKDYNTTSATITGTATTVMSNIDENIIMVLNGTQNSTITIDSKTGLFQKITVTSKNTGDTQVASANMSIPTTIDSTITYKIVK